ncbi:F-box domain containing protein [Rasamsonia emersonii CBS 393.64]|uniref:F-box domain containing protein n=1 Tax=Rasamsonia emersonii (strain ATCC 16479 / CBS 393.64 / IMI 116815) TaxID=1408163 RepID=A0A0F4YV84_RASE3|nr:F-box domain containing protein [Rasamsonia emersonii CBS 393.64]KKA22129.1 F-box domain containing protein [Rasamsonia emersonii CBS 393.64]
MPSFKEHGFVFHDACWSLLKEVYHDEPVPLERLVEVCRAVPFPHGAAEFMNWRHGYGGLVRLNRQSYYPWEGTSAECDDEATARLHAAENPCDEEEVQQLLKEQRQYPPSETLIGQRRVSDEKDCFMRIPFDVLDEIAAYLATADVLRLRQASRAFVPIFSSQSFWASQFEVNGEQGFLFEARRNKESRDWRWLYHRTNDAHGSPGLQNRKRIWCLNKSLKDILSMRWMDSSTIRREDLDGAEWRWKEVHGDLQHDRFPGRFHDGCRLSRKQCTRVPDVLSRIAVSTIRDGDETYIVGMRLISTDGADIYLGYTTEDRELSVDVTVFRGFVVAIGSRGINGLQVVMDQGSISRWLGCPDDSPKTRRLVVAGSIAALEAGFDAYKMITLAVAENPSVCNATSTEPSDPLRDTALWYPDIPPPGVFLNGEDFLSEYPHYDEEYQPLVWTLFGGLDGIYLRSLTGISIVFQRFVRAIEFHYNTDDIPTECRKMGRYRPSVQDKVTYFPIDGPGGEVIEAVELYVRATPSNVKSPGYAYGVTRLFKLFTNHGRSLHIQAERMPEIVRTKTLRAAPGTTITGFYAVHGVDQVHTAHE